MGPVVLRDYQQAAVEEIRQSFRRYGRVCFVLPTGGGKTITFSYVVQNAHAKGKSVVIIAHRREIVVQISAALTRMGVPHGIVAPGFRMTGDAVQVCMVQTLVRRLGVVPKPDLLVIDECHHAPAGSWLKVLDAWKGCKVLGVTATPIRLDKKGLAQAFDDMVLGPSMKSLIERGALARYIYLAPPSTLDMAAVTVKAGDWDEEETDQAVLASSAVGDAIDHYRKYLAGRPALVFCASVAGAEAIAQRFSDAGIPALPVDGEMNRTERARRLSMLESGDLKVITSCMIISEGFDVPAVAGAILLRPTMSLSLFLQQLGRSLRPKEDGGVAIILDHVGNVARHGMPDMDRVWTLDGLKGEADPVSQCKKCFIVQPTKDTRKKGFECPSGLGERTSIVPTPAEMDELPADDLKAIAEDIAEREALAERQGFKRGEDICPYLEAPEEQPEAAAKPVMAGDLEEVTDVRPIDHPEWAGGLSLWATGRQFFQLLDRAGADPERLGQIARTRGYKRGWVKHKIAEREFIEDELELFRDGDRDLTELTDQTLWALHREYGDYVDTQAREIFRDIKFELFQRRKSKAA